MKNKKQFRAKAILLMFILVLGFTALSCRKNPPTYYIPQDLKDYCMFPVGSWWVYEDSISGEKDSIVLVEQGARIYWKENYYNEELFQEFFSSHYGELKSYGTIDWANPRNNEYIYVYTGGGGLISFFGTVKSEYIDDLFFETIVINDVSYSEIKYFHSSQYPSLNTKTYWGKNIGAIRKETNDKIWNLKSYYINNQ